MAQIMLIKAAEMRSGGAAWEAIDLMVGEPNPIRAG